MLPASGLDHCRRNYAGVLPTGYLVAVCCQPSSHSCSPSPNLCSSCPSLPQHKSTGSSSPSRRPPPCCCLSPSASYEVAGPFRPNNTRPSPARVGVPFATPTSIAFASLLLAPSSSCTQDTHQGMGFQQPTPLLQSLAVCVSQLQANRCAAD